jgi:membrane protein YdbS with pleckstrin-like domain
MDDASNLTQPRETPQGRGDEEVRLVKVHPSLFRARPFACLFLLLAPIGIYVGVGWIGKVEWLRDPWWLLGPIIGWVWLAIWWFFKTRTVALEITTRRAKERRGFISRSGSDIYLDDIRNVRVRQTVMDRIFGVGRITLDTSAGGGEDEEIEIDDLPNPGSLRDLVNEHRRD